jgi:hypothetical protein
VKHLALAVVLVACAKRHESKLSPDDRAAALSAGQQCVAASDSLAPSYQMVGPRLVAALELDRNEARRLMRDSIELLISTRELLCNVSQASVEHALEQDPADEMLADSLRRVQSAQTHLHEVRTAYDALLGATSAADVPVDQDKLLEAMQHALLGP